MSSVPVRRSSDATVSAASAPTTNTGWRMATARPIPGQSAPLSRGSTIAEQVLNGDRSGPQRARELAPRVDVQLREGVSEVRLDRALGDEELLRDLPVRASLGRELRDAPLGGRECLAAREGRAPR